MNRIIVLAVGMLALARYSTASQAAISSFTITGVTVSQSTGAITVTGTIVCTVGDGEIIFDIMAQALKGAGGLAETSSIALGRCSGGTDPWTSPNTVVFGSIQQKTHADVDAGAEDPTDGTTALSTVRTRVILVP